MNTTLNNPHRAGGFSLIEVLMAVLILSLGLLGLGAIMPAVVKQQRTGTDQTFGTLAGRSVAALVKGNALYNGRNSTANTTNFNLQAYNRWEAWARCTSSAGYTYDIPEDGTWRVLEVEGDANGLGRAVIGPIGSGISANDDAFINLQDRLVPSVSAITNNSGGTIPEPQFVVDMAVRRVTPIDNAQRLGGALKYEVAGNFTVQVAFITRRIDQRIRPVGNMSIMQAVTDNTLAPNQRRWPVSEDSDGNPTGGGEFQGTGSPRYSLPYAVNVTFAPGTPDRLIVESAQDSALPGNPTTRTTQVAFQQLSQPGQIIVDNLGNIYTVQGADERIPNSLAVRISPPVSGSVPASSSSDPRRLHQVLVCAQPPAAVNIITVNP